MKKIIDYFKNLHKKFKKFIALNVLGKKYIRTGKCKACGKCCKEIYVRHSDAIIAEEEEFERLKGLHFFYNYLEIVDKNETGLVFACTKVHPETGKCTAYDKRALLCRMYPQEEVFMMGGHISEECGFSFEPILSFEEVFQKIAKKS